MRKFLVAAVLVAALPLLFACVTTPSLPCDDGDGLPPFNPQSCAPDWSLDLGTEVSAASLATMFTPADLEMDFSGTTVGIPTSGSVTLSLLDSSGGTLAATTFSWTRSGNVATLDNPSAVTSWVAAQSGNVADVSIETLPMTISTSPGTNTFQSTARYDGSNLATSAQTWTESAPCPDNNPMMCLE